MYPLGTLTNSSSTLVMVAFVLIPCSLTRTIASSLPTAIAPKITAPTNAASAMITPDGVVVTFSTVIAIQARRSAMKLSV
jgi:hypothetical protein